MMKKMALLLAGLLAMSAMGGCVVYPPGSASRARRQVDKLEEKLERGMDKLGEQLQDLEDWPDVEDRLRKVEIYDAKTDRLLGTLEDSAQLRDFEEAVSDEVGRRYNSLRDLERVFSEPKGLEREYRFEAYSASVGKLDRDRLYQVLVITTYKDSPIVYLEIGQEMIPVLNSLVTFNIELRQSQMDMLRNLAETAK